ncbi:hypothetical protein HDV00_001736 [Rhizophlyctis rosea]|nr:hypothetical protein HDV00_001736 [Rhizophlyctis rosea]
MGRAKGVKEDGKEGGEGERRKDQGWFGWLKRRTGKKEDGGEAPYPLSMITSHTSPECVPAPNGEQSTPQPTISSNTFALVIDGDALHHALSHTPVAEQFLKLGTRCASVICCRVSPKQKAQVVRMVKRGLGAMCLSIGDGANDVSMIQEAHIGVGIYGREGLQAAMASDYVISQFRFLAKLVLVHGQWSYYRTSEAVLTFFYKNMVWVFALFWYQIYCGFTADILYDYTYLMLYNLLFTSLPSFVMGIFDQCVDAKTAMAVPQLHLAGINQTRFTTLRFIGYVVEALYQSAICFFSGYFIYQTISPNGFSNDANILGTAVAAFVIVTVNASVGAAIKNWTFIVGVVVVGSCVVFFIYVSIWSHIGASTVWKVEAKLFRTWKVWLGLLHVVVLCMAPRLICKAWQGCFNPGFLEIVREWSKERKREEREIWSSGGRDVEDGGRHSGEEGGGGGGGGFGVGVPGHVEKRSDPGLTISSYLVTDPIIEEDEEGGGGGGVGNGDMGEGGAAVVSPVGADLRRRDGVRHHRSQDLFVHTRDGSGRHSRNVSDEDGGKSPARKLSVGASPSRQMGSVRGRPVSSPAPPPALLLEEWAHQATIHPTSHPLQPPPTPRYNPTATTPTTRRHSSTASALRYPGISLHSHRVSFSEHDITSPGFFTSPDYARPSSPTPSDAHSIRSHTSHVINLQTHTVEPVTGFAFSADEGRTAHGVVSGFSVGGLLEAEVSGVESEGLGGGGSGSDGRGRKSRKGRSVSDVGMGKKGKYMSDPGGMSGGGY